MMQHTEEFSHLTFSQREGLIPLPAPMKLGELSDDLRYELWQVFQRIFAGYDQDYGSYILHDFFPQFKGAYCKISGQPLREVDNFDIGDLYSHIENMFFDGKYNKLLDILESSLKIYQDYSTPQQSNDLDNDIPF